MAEPKEKYFLKFNLRNILANAIQAEDHCRYIKDSRPEHHSCVQKHLLFIRGELGEAISHASVVSPELVPKFKEILAYTERVLDEFEQGIKDPSEAIVKIRKIRRKTEEIFKPYDTSECKVCGDVEKVLRAFVEEVERIKREEESKKEVKSGGFMYWEKSGEEESKPKFTWYWEKEEKTEKPKSSVFNW